MNGEDKPSSSTDEENSRKRRGNGKTLRWEYIRQLQGPTRSSLWPAQLQWGESGRKGGQWGSQGPRLCGFGFHSNCDGNPLGGSKPGSDIILYCIENGFVHYFLLRKLLGGLSENQWFSRNLTFLADISDTSGPVLVAGNPGMCSQICTFLFEGPWLGQFFWLNNTSSYSCI